MSSNVVTRLVQTWRRAGISIAPGVPETALRDFEQRNGVTLPPDLRAYFHAVDGMLPSESDMLGFAFWPLARVRSAAEELRETSPPSLPPSGAEAMFVFADYMQWSWAYAIQLSPIEGVGNRIVVIGEAASRTVAFEFSAFLELYLSDPESLLAGE